MIKTRAGTGKLILSPCPKPCPTQSSMEDSRRTSSGGFEELLKPCTGFIQHLDWALRCKFAAESQASELQQPESSSTPVPSTPQSTAGSESSRAHLITVCVGWMCGCLSVLFHLFPFTFIHVDENAVRELQSKE